MPQVEKAPFHTSKEVEAALNIIQVASGNGMKLRIIADLTLHTGAMLSEIMELTEEDFVEGITFVVNNNPNRSCSLKKYWTYAPVKVLKNINKNADKEKRHRNFEKPFFSNKGEAFTEGYVRSSYSKISTKTGTDISLIRFRKTFYLDYLIRNGSVYDVAPEGTKDTRYTNDEYIAEKLGLSEDDYIAAKSGKWEPIIDVKSDCTEELLMNSINRLESRVKEMKSMIEEESHIYGPKGRELMTDIDWMSEMLEKRMYGKKLEEGEIPRRRNKKGW